MIPKGPLILGISCIVFVVVSIIGINSSEEFSSFMQMPPEKYKIIVDSKDLSEINKKALHYKEIEDEQELTLQTKLMKEKQEEIVSDIVGYDVMAWVDKFNFPYVDTVEIREGDDPFEICTIPEKILIHLENISKDKVFELFAKKYSNHHVQVTIQDERRDKSNIHYQFTATSSENENLTARIMYHIDSCTDEENSPVSLNCFDHENKQNFNSRFADNIIDSLNDDEFFCMITFEDWQQGLLEYNKVISKRAETVHEKIMQTMTAENFGEKIIVPLFEESDKVQLLQRIIFLASNSIGANEYLEDNIIEYQSKYGDLPDELQELLDARPISESNIETKNNNNDNGYDTKNNNNDNGYDTKNNNNDNGYDTKEYANTLSEINQRAITHQKNKEMEKFDEQMNLMQQKQKEIASEILRVNVSNVYIDEQWNFPFIDISEIEPFPGIGQPLPICDIPENIPTHLEKIRDSEMFSLFSEKYSQNYIEFDISDERRYNSVIHYSIRAMSEDQNRIASVFFHVNSCTSKISVPYNLECSNNTQDENLNHIQTRFKDEIEKSLDNDEFCVIVLELWHQNMRDYHDGISENIDQLIRDSISRNGNSDTEESYGFVSESQRLGLLNDLVRSATSGTLEDEKTQELILEYEKKYDSLPDDLVQLLEMKEQHFSSILNK